MKQLIAFLVVVFLFNSCKKEEEIQSTATTLPTPDFYFTLNDNPDHTISLNIKNLSKDADEYVWYLDNKDSIIAFEPTYILKENRPYKVTLKASNRYGTKMVNQFVNIFSIPIIADFNVIINLDTPNLVRFVNKSTNFDNLTWNFGDGTTSSELNPSHDFSNNLDRQVKLVIENNENKKDSITITFPFNKWRTENECELYLKDLNNFKYLVKTSAYQDGKHSYSIGPNYTSNPLPLNDSVLIDNNSSEKTYFVKYYTSNKITSYRKYSTIDLSNFISDLPNLIGTYNFTNRKIEYTFKEPNYYNDTNLAISYSNGLITIEDKNLQHKITGYLSSISSPNEYVFKYPTYIVDKTVINQKIVFSRNTNSVDVEQNTYWSDFGHSSNTKLTYKGNK